MEKFGVRPDQLGDVLALMGDSVDNVPGVPGIGPKTAAKLIHEYGDLEGVLAAAPDDEAEQDARQSDRACRRWRGCRASWSTLQCDAPLPDPLEELELEGHSRRAAARVPRASRLQVAARAGWRAVADRRRSPRRRAARCRRDARRAARAITTPTRPWSTRPRSTAGSPSARHQGWIAIDTETDRLDATRAELVGISLALAPNLACYIPLGHGGSEHVRRKAGAARPRAWRWRSCKPLLEDPAVLKIGHNSNTT